MCGIIGYSGSFSPELMERGNAMQRHRGPDDAGVFIDASAAVGLGHTRLSILDLSESGHQPMFSQDGAVVIVYNGELYNFLGLREELKQAGYQFRSRSDTEVLLNLYLAEGEAMLPRLNGIFAFAIWDRRKGTMLVVRDGFGIKPLYFTETAGGVAFASELKALLCLAPGAREIDPVALHRYLSFLWCPGEGTPLKGVCKLGPGESLRLREGKIVERRLWRQLPPFRGICPDLSESEAISGTQAALRRAVHDQMISDVPLGAFLSGGLDSSAIVAMAREQQPDIQCFTIRNAGGQDRGFVDDLPYAMRVARHLNVPLEIVDVSDSDIAGDLQQMVAQLDEPVVDTAPLNVLYISRIARRNGIKVLLSGAGGDDVFSGYRRHFAISYERAWNWLPGPVLQMLESATARLDQRRPAFRRLAKLFNGASLTGDARIANYFLWARESQLKELYSEHFLAGLGGVSAVAPLLEFLRPLPQRVSPLSRMLALEQRFFLADFNLLFTDKMSMAVGVETRVPFLDNNLVDFAARIPDRFKQRGREGKWILKKAMEPYLPADVIHRPKTGFGGPLRRWLQGELRSLLHEMLSAESLRRRGLFAPEAVASLIRRNEAGEVDATYVLLSLLCIEIWCRCYLDA